MLSHVILEGLSSGHKAGFLPCGRCEWPIANLLVRRYNVPCNFVHPEPQEAGI
jgi:hypothetical protein